MYRTGHGFDVHRFATNRKLVLCGEHIPLDRGLLGHSDADVATHALIDALLGAAALGDIGSHFPDTSDEFKDADSLMLLGRTVRMVRRKGYVPVNCDVTIIAQSPKLAPYIGKMRRNLADALGCAVDAVSVKATTTEKLGFTGRGEGMAAEAVALLKKVDEL